MSAVISSTKLERKLKELAGKLEFTQDQIKALNQFSSHANNWKIWVIDPFYTAYYTAYNSYKAVLKADEEARKREMEMAFLALSLCGGSIMLGLLGKMTLGKLIENQALNYICNNNMERTFKVMAFAKGNEVAKFLINEAKENTREWLTEKTKNLVRKAGTGGNYRPPTDPQILLKQMEKFYILSEQAVRSAFDDLLNNRKMDNHSKRKILNRILASPFCQSPTSSVYNESVLTDKIELSFYLQIVMDSDYMAETSHNCSYRPSGDGQKIPIHTSPKSKNYPQPTTIYDGFSGSSSYLSVGYSELGANLIKRMNSLYTKANVLTPTRSTKLIKDGSFFSPNRSANRELLKKAEVALEQLGKETELKVFARVKPNKKVLP